MLKFVLISIPFLFVIGSVMHFVYTLSKNNLIIALIAPVNESIFEHSKLLLFPITIVWLFYYFINKSNISSDNYFWAMLINIIISIIVMFSFYYTYKGILGNSYLWMDILDLLISLIISQLVANHVYVYSKGVSTHISFLILIFIYLIYFYLTFKPLKIPLFFDEKNKIYGINKK